MKLIEGLSTDDRIIATFKRRVNRVLRLRRYALIEMEIKRKLGEEYNLIGNKIPYDLIPDFREKLNRDAWKSERLFLERLTQAGVLDFFTNYPVLNRFFIDVYFHDIKVAVELDGSIHNNPEVKAKDERKTYWLKRFGIKVFRYKIGSAKDAELAVNDLLKYIDKSKLCFEKKSNGPKKRFRKAKGKNLEILIAYEKRKLEFEKIIQERKRHKSKTIWNLRKRR